MAASTPSPDLEGSSSSPADGHSQRSRNASIGSEEASGNPEHEDAENEKRHSDESLYPPHDGVKERDRDSDTERSSEVRCPPITRTVSEVHDGIESRRDVEIGDGVEQQAGVGSQEDPNLVTWDGPDDPQNPKTWTMRKKWAAVTIVSLFTLISPLGSTMIAPALTAIGRDLSIPSAFDQALTLSIFILAYAVGPLFLGPMSELYGRVPVLQLSNLVFLFFNLGCGLAQTKGQMMGFRFMAGLGGSAPLAIGGGVLGDLFTAEQRGRAMSIYSLAPLLGPAIGPIAGGFVTQRTSWRWVFYATTIADAVIQLAGLFLLRETFAPVLLARKRARLVRETGNAALHTEYDRPDRTVTQTLTNALTRPFRLLGTQVIVQVLALYLMFLYGQLYLQLSTFPRLWETKYGESVEIGGLNYISLGLGLWLGSQICAPLQDRVYAWMKRREGVEVGRPEFRTPMMIPGAVAVPVGLLIYGWGAQYRVHWIVPNIGVAIFAAGTIIGFQCIQGYLVDSYTLYAASAVGAGTVLRSLAGFGFPLFAPQMYDRLDYGWGNTTLALVAVVIGWPAPILLWKYGEKLRKRSPFAAGG
ncbi:MFS general substrate transporter [Phialemonium atrogriseum]|uniref:MFS general substrate transporter n=1 Tax=Phialemonium atrogriseum TaxID=1093897 RepID=A0AAJ0BYZ8_9PEZI|nr:MFS general substrate transporter [Phialemonium atrogriseum]KAK1766846.1 MFS general substrate transporter [Phialemonium atrogriseum]